MAEEVQIEAGVFARAAEGWLIVKRRKFADQAAASKKNPSQRTRGSILKTTDWMTLDSVLADYERKRVAGILNSTIPRRLLLPKE